MTPLKKSYITKLTYLPLEDLIIILLLIFTVPGAVAIAVVPVRAGRCEAVAVLVDRCSIAPPALVSNTPGGFTIDEYSRL